VVAGARPSTGNQGEPPATRNQHCTMTHTHSEYFIEKQQLPVTISLVTGEDLTGSLFVQHTWRQPSMEVDAPALLNLPEAYFPLQLANGKTRLIAKAHVVVMRGERSEDGDDATLGDPAEVVIRCSNGLIIQGSFRIARISSSTRVLDYLNRPAEEFMLVHNEESAMLVNRRHIAVVHDNSDGTD
jgi:hypothetical protein